MLSVHAVPVETRVLPVCMVWTVEGSAVMSPSKSQPKELANSGEGSDCERMGQKNWALRRAARGSAGPGWLNCEVDVRVKPTIYTCPLQTASKVVF